MLNRINFYITAILVVCPIHLMASPELNYTVKNDTITEPLNGLKGNAENGRKLVKNQNKGNCLSCHQLPIPEDDFHGTIGPSLHKVYQRLTEAQIRLRVTDMKQLNPFSIMPGYYRSPEKINRISPQYENSTILSAQEVEDIVSYLLALKVVNSE